MDGHAVFKASGFHLGCKLEVHNINRILNFLITYADNSRGSKAVILSVCPHDKTKTAETTITKLATDIVHHESSPTN